MDAAYDPLADTGTVPSPCTGICKINARSGLCEGCFRTLDEIAVWSGASEDEKRAVWMEIRKREQAAFD